MSEYGIGVSLAESFMFDKERIKMALQGKLMCGETENGFEYREADKAECDEYIVSAFDNAVYRALSGAGYNDFYNKLLGKAVAKNGESPVVAAVRHINKLYGDISNAMAAAGEYVAKVSEGYKTEVDIEMEKELAEG